MVSLRLIKVSINSSSSWLFIFFLSLTIDQLPLLIKPTSTMATNEQEQQSLWSNIYQTAMAINDKYKPYFKCLELRWTSQTAMAKWTSELDQQNFVNLSINQRWPRITNKMTLKFIWDIWKLWSISPITMVFLERSLVIFTFYISRFSNSAFPSLMGKWNMVTHYR